MQYLRFRFILIFIIVASCVFSCKPVVIYRVVDNDSNGSLVDPNGDIDEDDVLNGDDVDDDNDGLIEIATMEELYNMRHNLNGDSYRASSASNGVTTGQPTSEPDACDDNDASTTVLLCGYELGNNLDFDFDEDGEAWSGNFMQAYAIDKDDAKGYFDDSNGWTPIGTINAPFNAIFEGNNNKIRNLAIVRSGPDIGFFGLVASGAEVRNITFDKILIVNSGASGADIGGAVGHLSNSSTDSATLTNVHITGTSYIEGGAGDDRIGGMVGNIQNGMVSAVTSTANVQTNAGNDRAGGVAGYISAGTIVASSADFTSMLNDSDVSTGAVGGLVGEITGGTTHVLASYAKGSITSNSDGSSGGLIGLVDGANVLGSYASVSIAGGAGASTDGTLIGRINGAATINDLYATGSIAADAGDSSNDIVGCIGSVTTATGETLTIANIYCTGSIAGGGGNDASGGIIGVENSAGTFNFAASYYFGTTNTDIETTNTITSPANSTSGLSSATALTQANSSTVMASQWLSTIWDFGTSVQTPALIYGDYDGSGGENYCTLFPSTVPGGSTTLTCGETLLAGEQR